MGQLMRREGKKAGCRTQQRLDNLAMVADGPKEANGPMDLPGNKKGRQLKKVGIWETYIRGT